MMRAFTFLTISVITLCYCHGQTTVCGKVLDREIKQPIQYANIGIQGLNVGTIANADGSFCIPIPLRNLSDTLTISAVGFRTTKVSINFLSGSHSNIIFLDERVTLLNEVLITGKREKIKRYELGNRSFKGGVLESDTTYAGRAISLLIDSTLNSDVSFPLYVEGASLRIFRNNLPSFKFRVRLNDVNPVTGGPGIDLLEKSVVLESTMRSGWLDFDLSRFKQVVYGPFYITFEQIVDVHDRRKIAEGYQDFIRKHPEKLRIDTVEFNGKKEAVQILKRGGIDLPGTFVAISNSRSSEYTCYIRETSFATWKKVRGIVTAYVTVSNQDTTKIKDTK